MKKSNIYKFLYVVSALLVLGFAIHLGVDMYRYNKVLTSAPRYVFVIAHAIEYLLPGFILFVIGIVLKRKYAHKEDKGE